MLHVACSAGAFVLKLGPTPVSQWTVACQASLSVAYPGQEYWTGLPFNSLGDLPQLGIKRTSAALQSVFCIAGRLFTAEPPGETQFNPHNQQIRKLLKLIDKENEVLRS